MKKIIITLSLLCIVYTLQAQTITAAEFFVDADPGLGNGTPITVSPTGATVNFNATIPTNTLSNGFHFVGIRTKDDSGKWGLYENRGFYISSSANNVSNITAAEFFVDADPGVGNGTAITPITSGANPTFVATIPTTSLAAGFHFVAIRTKDADGKWGLYENRGFYISSSTSNVSNIVAAEFFVDADPGVGSGTAIAAIPSGANPSFVATIPTSSLTAGFHFVAIRTKDADGKWGLYENRGFYISSATTNVSNIVAAEFFVDADPGVGNATAITPAPNAANPTFVATIPTTSLAVGFHFVAIRTKDATGKWGLFENRGFYISTQTANVGNMVKAEYFIDTDPGVGNGTAFTIPNASSINQNFVLNIPAGTSQGQHFIAIRMMDEWGLYDFDTITVAGTVPLKLLSFDAYKLNKTVQLKWQTENEINTSHFEIERSGNGVSFVKIGTVQSLNTSGTNNYSFEDVAPFKGINYYRLKQVDIDGSFTYSNINKVMFETFGDAVNIFPNPAKDYIQFDYTGKQKTILVNLFDAQGRLMKTTTLANLLPLKLNIENLAKGKYIIQLSDGITIAVGSFIKQ